MPNNDPALDIAQRLLARRDHSRAELAGKLRLRGIDPQTISSVIATCLHYDWLNDTRFAEHYIHYRSEAGFGPLRILSELDARQVDGNDIPDINNQEVDWFELARNVAKRKFKQQLGQRELWSKQARFLAGRGFATAHIRYALQQQ